MTRKSQAPPELHNSGAVTPTTNGSKPECKYCAKGLPRVPSAVKPDGFIHNDDRDGRVVCTSTAEPAPEKPARRESPTIEYLPVRYTTPERMDIAEQLGRAAQAQGDLEDQKKAQDAEHKEALEACKLQIKRLSRKMASGSEMRNVQCVWLLGDPTPDEKTLVRKDTGEIVRTVPMQDHDYQEELPITKSAGTNGSAETLVLEPPPDGKSAASAND